MMKDCNTTYQLMLDQVAKPRRACIFFKLHPNIASPNILMWLSSSYAIDQIESVIFF